MARDGGRSGFPGGAVRRRDGEQSLPPALHLAVFISDFDNGGMEKMLVNLAAGLCGEGVRVDFLVNRVSHRPYLERLPPAVRRIELGGVPARALAQRLAEYLRESRPATLLSTKERDEARVLRARRRAGVPLRIVLRTGIHISGRLAAQRRNALARWLRVRALRRACREADGLVAVSAGVAEDLARLAGVHRDRIRVIPNPVITPDFPRLAAAPVEHPWLGEGEPPVILGVGRLARAKDFPTLLRAFARVRAERDCRLLILGEGRQRNRLLALARELGVAADVDLPGFVDNPCAWMARARLLALSSRAEGSPNRLTEALALGVPVVSTDCPSGPRELLRDGRVGRLVPMGDSAALAAAIRDTLDHPPDPGALRAAVRDYRQEASVRRYLDVLFPRARTEVAGGAGEGAADGA